MVEERERVGVWGLGGGREVRGRGRGKEGEGGDEKYSTQRLQ